MRERITEMVKNRCRTARRHRPGKMSVQVSDATRGRVRHNWLLGLFDRGGQRLFLLTTLLDAWAHPSGEFVI